MKTHLYWSALLSISLLSSISACTGSDTGDQVAEQASSTANHTVAGASSPHAQTAVLAPQIVVTPVSN